MVLLPMNPLYQPLTNMMVNTMANKKTEKFSKVMELIGPKSQMIGTAYMVKTLKLLIQQQSLH